MDLTFFEKSVKFFASCVDQVNEIDESVILRWIEMLDEQISHLNCLLSNATVEASKRRKLQTFTIHLSSARSRILAGCPQGGNLSADADNSSPTLVWDDAQSAF